MFENHHSLGRDVRSKFNTHVIDLSIMDILMSIKIGKGVPYVKEKDT